MSRLLRTAALALAVFGTVWLAVLWRWRATGHAIGPVDLALGLVVLPAIVFGLITGLRRAFAGTGGAPAATSTRAPATAPEAAAASTSFLMLSAEIACVAGTRADEVAAALADPALRPGLDPELRDADGFPIFTARIDGVAVEATADELAPIVVALRTRSAGWAVETVDAHVERALAILAGPLEATLAALVPAADVATAARGASGAGPDEAPALRWLQAWPADWTDFERELASEWARRRLARVAALASVRIVLQPQAVETPEALWLQVDLLLRTLERDGRADRVLVSACDSGLSDTAVAALEREGRLFSAQHRPRGAMPGEAAAVLLLANRDLPGGPGADPAPVIVHRAVSARRSAAVDASGRTAERTADGALHDGIDRALAGAGLAADAIRAVVSDADQHSRRGAELYGAVLARLPGLDPADDLRLTGVACGRTGIVDALLVAALAAERARTLDAPCLAICSADSFQRAAWVTCPPDSSTLR